MATILKCKMCGGDIEVSQDMTVGKCLFCGSTMTMPRIDSDKKARLFNRANEYRLNNEFNKAYDAYKTITEEDEQEAEAYWGMILSEYGVEYVEDPTTGKRIPTCHRTQVQSIRSSSNYKLALQYADAERKFIYQDDAERIDKLQKAILAVSSQEEPYDVFICYKETEADGETRTKDSVLAQDIYHELEKNGIRVFFSRISMETHLGENYEPYIYSALKSARVMLMVSTSGENCEAVWVKNEWLRFLQFMSEDDGKVLIPVYQNMSPYEFPEELSGFQAQDMGKVGAIQDLVYGVKKVLGQKKSENHNETINTLVKDYSERKNKEVTLRKRIKVISIISVVVLVFIASVFLYFGIKREKENSFVSSYQELAQLKYSSSGYNTNGTIKVSRDYRWLSGITCDEAIEQMEALVERDPHTEKTYKAQSEVVCSWIDVLQAESLLHAMSSIRVKQIENDTEDRIKLAKMAVKVYYSLPPEYDRVVYNDEVYSLRARMDSALTYADRMYRGAMFGEAARVYAIFAPYNEDAEEKLNWIIKDHPDIVVY